MIHSTLVRNSLIASAFLHGVMLFPLPATAAEPPQPVAFSSDIQPILAAHCVVCHGPDQAEAGLRLDRAAEGDDTELLDSLLSPGDAANSELLRRVTTDDEAERMPPEGDPLSDDEADLLRRWIDQGAGWQGHWAFQPIELPDVPRLDAAEKTGEWLRNPVDAFVLQRMKQSDVTPSPPADRATLIKRLYYDLLGLPPTPAAVDAFVQNEAADAYPRLVDRLLASPHFGERWGRHWLDKARYADSDGYEKDRPRPNAWRYRDWVLEAVNNDVPYDQFTIEQLAGDLLPQATPQQRLATAFHRQTLTNTEGGVDQEEFRVEATFDRTETTAAIWMGLTMTCARCHNHKYDPIEQQEYYRLFAFFNEADEAQAKVPTSRQAMEQFDEAQQSYQHELTSLRERYLQARSELRPDIEAWEQEMRAALSEEPTPIHEAAAEIVEAKTAGKAVLELGAKGSITAQGPVPEKDKYTLVLEAPSQPLTGLRLELLTDESLPKQGPGRAGNGNFVLSQLRLYLSDDPNFRKFESIPLVAAEADFAQNKFAPSNVLTHDPKTGWAISPQMGQDHQLTVWTERPWQIGEHQFLQVVLDQQYGGKHTIGRFRLSTLSGFDPLRALPAEVAQAIRIPAAKRKAADRERIADHVALQHPQTAELAKRLARLENDAPQPPLMEIRVMAAAERTTHLLHRGDFLQPDAEVEQGVLAAVRDVHPLPADPSGRPADRLALARWLVDPAHPLTSRVSVNHVWAHLFGRGIVPTINDFGVRGEQPTHPQLLDWLAWQYPRHLRWSRKQLIRTIVNSGTYRQAAIHRPELEKTDPTNRLFARQNRMRVEAEVIRDVQLSVSGLLTRRIGGPSVFPPLPAGVAELSYAKNCLLARRMVERGVRFVNIIYASWDHHSNIPSELPYNAGCVDQPIAALISDLKQRGLLDSTMVVWGTEFGRTPLGENRGGKREVGTGRDHHPYSFSMLMSGGGLRGGLTYGATDEIGWNVTENPVHINDLHATMLHQFGLDHLKLTHRFQGRDFRLTDVGGKVIHPWLASPRQEVL